MEQQQQKATILAVDDSRVMLVAAAKALKAEFEVLKAADGQEAWNLIQQHPEISVVFSDLAMPNMNGYDLLEAVRGSDNAQIAKLPVVILTGQEDGDGTKEKVMAAGATDYLIKPFESLDLLSRARSLSSLSTQVNELEKKVSLDKLTRLYTEHSFNDSGERSVAHAIRTASSITVLRFDIDNFSALFVNHGKQVAEAVVSKVAEIIKTMLRQEDVAARLGVAKFSLMMIETDVHGAEKVSARLKQAINEADFGPAGQITITIGCASQLMHEGVTFESIKDHAEQVYQSALAKGNAQTVCIEIGAAGKDEAAAAEPARKKGPRIDLSAVLREVEKNNGQRLGEKQINAALNTVLPLLSFLDDKMSLNIADVIKQLSEKVNK